MPIKYKFALVEPKTLEEVGLEPMIDMAFAADLCGMTYDQFNHWVFRNKKDFPPRYRRVKYKHEGCQRWMRKKIRVFYPFEIRRIRESSLRGPGKVIHNAADYDRYQAHQKGENLQSGRDTPLSEGTTPSGTP